MGLPKLRVVRKHSLNGEIHIVFPESILDENTENVEDFDELKMRNIVKKEASKPLFLLRSE